MSRLKGRPIRDLSGQKFGLLVAIKPTYERRNGQVMWECMCECGTKLITRRQGLTSGHCRSCGCIRSLALPRSEWGG